MMSKTSTINANEITIIQKKNLYLLLTVVVIVGLIMIAGYITEYSHVEGIMSIPAAMSWMASNMWFSSSTLSNLGSVLRLLWETVLISIVSTTTAAVFAVVFALFGSKLTYINKPLMYAAKIIASISRNIPVVAWALILVISFGTNSMTGFLALFFGSFGFLVRAFLETIDEGSADSVEALKAAGATYWHTIFKAVLPDSMPQMFSWILFMIETNIRSATLVGLLTGTGIGYLFDLYYKQLNYEMVSLITIAIVLAVLVIEAISNIIRREIL
jgi:phosphonate transport system permease protein